jgi:transcriptional regulator with XRE-family HTH domain
VDRLAIKHFLLDQEMTLVRLAARAGMSYDRLIKVVNGYRPPTPSEIAAIADALDVPTAAICSELDRRPCSNPS